jgi:hypothetical protein
MNSIVDIFQFTEFIRIDNENDFMENIHGPRKMQVPTMFLEIREMK